MGGKEEEEVEEEKKEKGKVEEGRGCGGMKGIEWGKGRGGGRRRK